MLDKSLLPDPASYFEGHGQKIIGRGKHFRTQCSIHGGTGFNLSVVRETGGFNCFSCGAHGGDLVSFVMQADGLDFVSACKALGAWVDDGKPHPVRKPSPITARDALSVLAREALVIVMAAGSIGRGDNINDIDRARCQRAAGRINQIRGIYQ